MMSYFKCHFFPTLADFFFQFGDHSYALNLATKAVLQK